MQRHRMILFFEGGILLFLFYMSMRNHDSHGTLVILIID